MNKQLHWSDLLKKGNQTVPMSTTTSLSQLYHLISYTAILLILLMCGSTDSVLANYHISPFLLLLLLHWIKKLSSHGSALEYLESSGVKVL